jgi:hypothetical protein
VLLLSPALSVLQTSLVEGVAFVQRLSSRRGNFLAARRRADLTGKPLVVVGSRTRGYVRGTWSQYTCGDLPCVDLDGCRDDDYGGCGAPPTNLETQGAIGVSDGGAVVCVQYVLEYVNDIDAAWREVQRAAGSPDDVFVTRVQGWATLARLGTRCRRILDDAPPNRTGELVYHDVWSGPRDVARPPGRRVL